MEKQMSKADVVHHPQIVLQVAILIHAWGLAIKVCIYIYGHAV